MSPDGKNVYAASFTSSAVSVFARDETTGALTQLGDTTTNTAPVVSAGPDQTITLPAAAALDGTVTDDGQPAALTTTWSQVSGPGTVTFGSASSVDTAATFTQAGNYTLRLTAFDGDLTSLDELGVTVVPATAGSALSLSLAEVATIGGVTAQNEDILSFDGTSFGLAFDGSDVGLAALRIDAFAWVDSTNLVLSFDVAGTVPGIPGTVDDSDVVLFTGSVGTNTVGSFSLHLDGSDVGLTAGSEDVDAVELLANGNLLLSTFGVVAVAGLSAEDKDVLEFSPTSLGPLTTGSFSIFFDGSDVDLTTSGEDIDAVAVDAGTTYLSTLGNFAVTGISGADEDVFVFTPTSVGGATAGTYSRTLVFDGSTFGLAASDVLAIDLP